MTISLFTNSAGRISGNILGFEQAFPGAKVIRLEQNYRLQEIFWRLQNRVIEK